MGQFTKPNGGTHKADKIERMEEVHAVGFAVWIHPWDQYVTQDRQRIDYDQRDQRCP